jgi:hypothetical protein
MDARFGGILYLPQAMLSEAFFHEIDDVPQGHVEAKDVLLGEVEEFDAVHLIRLYRERVGGLNLEGLSMT